MQQPKQPFLETLYHLRTLEQVILYNKITDIPVAEEKATLDFLEAEYEREAADYPFTAPKFNSAAALWGAKTLYFSAQLLLYREGDINAIQQLVAPFAGSADAAAMLSADVCLRFLPTVLDKLLIIDTEDPLIPIVQKILTQFHYSAIGVDVALEGVEVQPLFKDRCFRQLYLDRVTQRRAIKWLALPLVKQGVLENLGNHKAHFWREATLEANTP